MQLCVLIAVALLFSPLSAQSQPAPSSADARLRALYTVEWNWRQQELGRGTGDRFPRLDAASQQARLAYWTRTLAALDTIPFDQLSPEEKINAQIFRTSLRALASDVQYRTYEAPFNSDTFFWNDFTPRSGFAAAAAYRSYLARLRDVPRYFDEQIANMRAGLARGYSVPRVSVLGRDRTIEPYVKGDASNPLCAPFTQFPAGVTAADQDALRAEAATVIRDIVAPAYTRLLTMITTEIDRYIAWPGQALAYKLGELQIRRHRREAEEKLGARFDQRRFHDAILAIGSVPLPVLEERMARFIADESAAPKE